MIFDQDHFFWYMLESHEQDTPLVQQQKARNSTHCLDSFDFHFTPSVSLSVSLSLCLSSHSESSLYNTKQKKSTVVRPSKRSIFSTKQSIHSVFFRRGHRAVQKRKKNKSRPPMSSCHRSVRPLAMVVYSTSLHS